MGFLKKKKRKKEVVVRWARLARLIAREGGLRFWKRGPNCKN